MTPQPALFYLNARFWGIILGPLVLIGWMIWIQIAPEGGIPAPALELARHKLAGVILFTILWWLTEPIPIPMTGLLAIILCYIFRIPHDILLNAPNPIAADLVEREALKTILRPFAEPTVYFLFGGMCLGTAMTRHGLDKRFALNVLCAPGMGRSPTTVLLGIGLAVMLISTVISNTGAAAMILPIAIQVLAIMDHDAPLPSDTGSESTRFNWTDSRYGSALLLMTAYGSSVGGICTPIGTTTNVVAMGFFQQSNYFGKKFDFFQWMQIGIPMAVILFAALFFWLWFCAKVPRIEIRLVRENLRRQKNQLGRWSLGEINVLFVFIAAMSLWMLPGLVNLLPQEAASIAKRWIPNLPEELVALMIPIALFILPSRTEHYGTMAEEDLRHVDWGTLLLFGSGLALGMMVDRTGLAREFAERLRTIWPTVSWEMLTGMVILAAIVLSEFTSNAATITMLIPVVWNMCGKWNIDPLVPMMGMTFGASFGSALPVSTPPNALVYGTGKVPMLRMIAYGVVFDGVCWLVLWGGFIVVKHVGWKAWNG